MRAGRSATTGSLSTSSATAGRRVIRTALRAGGRRRATEGGCGCLRADLAPTGDLHIAPIQPPTADLAVHGMWSMRPTSRSRRRGSFVVICMPGHDDAINSPLGCFITVSAAAMTKLSAPSMSYGGGGRRDRVSRLGRRDRGDGQHIVSVLEQVLDGHAPSLCRPRPSPRSASPRKRLPPAPRRCGTRGAGRRSGSRAGRRGRSRRRTGRSWSRTRSRDCSASGNGIPPRGAAGGASGSRGPEPPPPPPSESEGPGGGRQGGENSRRASMTAAIAVTTATQPSAFPIASPSRGDAIRTANRAADGDSRTTSRANSEICTATLGCLSGIRQSYPRRTVATDGSWSVARAWAQALPSRTSA